MTSKEALERLKQELYLILPKNIRDNLIDTIKQDLENLEIVNKNFDKTLATSVELMNKNLELQACLEAL